MNITRCPTCKSHINLEQAVQDESAKTLLMLLAKQNKRVGAALVSYLGLFRPAKQDLTNSRALKLANQVLELTPKQQALAAALEQTHAQIMQKRLAYSSDYKPLANHNYLKQVLSSTLAQSSETTAAERKNTIEIKQQGRETTEEENLAAFHATLAKYRASNTNKE